MITLVLLFFTAKILAIFTSTNLLFLQASTHLII